MMKGKNSGNELISRKPPKDNAVEHSSHEKENDFIIYDTFETNFDLNVFVWELFLHLTHLVTVFNPLTHVVDSKLPLVYTMSNHLSQAMFYVMLISYTIGRVTDSTSVGYNTYVVPMIMFIAHRTMVAFKYATLSPSEYRRVMNVKTPEEILAYQTQLQLLTAWMSLNPITVNFELLAATSKVGADLDKFHFIIPEENISEWKAFFTSTCIDPSALLILSSGAMRVTIGDMCRAMISSVVEYGSSSDFVMKHVIYFFAIASSIVPFAMTNFEKVYPADIIFLISSTLINVLFFCFVQLFMYTPVVDIQRRLQIAKLLSRFIRVEVCANQDLVRRWLKESLRAEETDDTLTQNAMHTVRKSEESLVEEGAKKPPIRAATKRESVVYMGFKMPSIPADTMGKADGALHLDGDSRMDRTPKNTTKSEKSNKAANHPLRAACSAPQINLDYPQNVYAWIYTRSIFQQYGSRMRFRMNLYIGVYLLLAIVIGAVLMFLFLTVDPATRDRMTGSVVFVQTNIVIISVFVLVITLINGGTLANLEFGKQSELIILNSMRTSARLAEIVTEIEELNSEDDQVESIQNKKRLMNMKLQLEEARKAHHEALSSIAVNDKANPVTVLGMEASYSLLVSLATGLAAMVSPILKQLEGVTHTQR